MIRNYIIIETDVNKKKKRSESNLIHLPLTFP